MSRHALLLAIPLLLALAACGGSSSTLPGNAANTSSAAQAAAGRYVVGFAPGVSIADVQSVAAGLANRPDHSYHTSFNGFAGPLTAAERNALAADPRIAFVEPDIEFTAFPKPPWAGGGGGEDPPGQETPWGVTRIHADANSDNAGGAWNGGSGVRVAVIDTGIDLNHEDLIGNVEDGYNFVHPGDPADDDNGHGTHVAGTIAGVNNLIGVVGVAPQAKVVAVKVLDRRGRGWLSDIIDGVDWVGDQNNDGSADNDIQVANMSLGGRGSSSGLAAAITYATNSGVTFVVAAGNEFDDANNYIPATYNNVITVSALDQSDNFAYFSNYGADVDLIAPGVNVPSLYKNGGYKTLSGTSMASPHVAGAAALWLDDNPGDTFAAVKAALQSNGEAGPWPGDPDGIPEPLVDAQPL